MKEAFGQLELRDKRRTSLLVSPGLLMRAKDTDSIRWRQRRIHRSIGIENKAT